MTEPTTLTLEVPGAQLQYDVHAGESDGARPLLLIGSPMGAAGFRTLAGHFADRTVVTYDPRGAERSKLTEGGTERRGDERAEWLVRDEPAAEQARSASATMSTERRGDERAEWLVRDEPAAEQARSASATSGPECTPDQHADDLHQLISTLDLGPVDIFASSGGAVNALALVAGHPRHVGTLVAHEPPAAQLLPDREAALAATLDIRRTYQRDGFGPAMAKFIGLVSHQGPIPSDFAEQPAPSPADFGLPTEDDGSRDDPLTGLNIVTCTHYRHDLDALRSASTRIVLAVGADSTGELAHRGGVAVAEQLGTEPVVFPGDHAGFAGGEYGMVGEPEAFAAKLREVLDAEPDFSRR